MGEFQASTADAVFVVEGIALPVHVGAVMAPASGVFAKPAPASAVPLTYALGAEGQHLHVRLDGWLAGRCCCCCCC